MNYLKYKFSEVTLYILAFIMLTGVFQETDRLFALRTQYIQLGLQPLSIILCFLLGFFPYGIVAILFFYLGKYYGHIADNFR